MINFDKELNSEQLRVVLEGDGPCLVLAGAGSGKTRTITYRVAYLLEKGVDPKNILLVTFTNKAAHEMIRRVQELTQGEITLPWSGTFHHIGYRILKKYAQVLGFQNNFSVLDSEDSRDMIKSCIKQEGIDRTQRRFPSPNVVQSIISYARNAEMTIHDVLELQHEQWINFEDILVSIAQEYTKRKKSANVMDFDDLLVYFHLLLLKSEDVRNKYAQQFLYVLVDEYQDTNKIQASIINLCASIHKNILVVGDDAQSIYSFRAADIQNILSFSARGGSASGGETVYPDAKIFKLETNYRSTPEILDVANEVIANNTKQYKKELVSVLQGFTKPEVHAFTDAGEEAEFILNRISELRDEGVPLSEIAVLFRAAFHSQQLEMRLTKEDIPYDYRGGIRFFERAHVKDILAYLRMYNNIQDTIAWSRVLNMQVGIGPAGVQKIYEKIVAGGAALEPPVRTEHLRHLGSVLPARGQIGWSDFLQIWEKLNKVHNKIPSELIRAVIDSKYQEYLENEYPDYRDRMQDLEQLAVFAERYMSLEDPSEALDRFLGEATLQESYHAQQAHDNSGGNEERLILSTVHQAKGLEWSAVFVLNVSAGQFPNDRASRGDDLEEERRLFYVAITRAKKYLYLTYPLVSNSHSLLQGPSPFIDEINRDLIDYNTNEDDTTFFDPSSDDDDVTYESLDVDTPRRSFLKGLDEL